jgi:hypothetical protein
VTTDGDRLVVRGPRTAEALAKEILKHKPAVMAALCLGDHTGSDNNGTFELDPAMVTACKRCGSLELWWNGHGETRCLWCNPPTAAMNLLTRANEIRSRHPIGINHRRTTTTDPQCGSCRGTEFIDTAIHGGRSIRRDCAQCGLTAGFPMWFGKIDKRLRPN